MGSATELQNLRVDYLALDARVYALEHAGGQQLITSAILNAAYMGAWTTPNVSGPGPAARHIAGSQAVHIREGGDILLKADPTDRIGYARFPKPTPSLGPLAETPISPTWHELPEPSLGNLPPSVPQNYGWLRSNGHEYVSIKSYYATSGVDYPSQMRDGIGLYACPSTISEAVCGVKDPTHHNKIAGAMCYPPPRLASQYDYFLTLVGTPGLGSASWGLSLAGVDWSSGNPVATPFLMHDRWNVAPYYDEIIWVRGVAWIETDNLRGVLFTAMKPSGHVWYGYNNGLNGSSPYHFYNRDPVSGAIYETAVDPATQTPNKYWTWKSVEPATQLRDPWAPNNKGYRAENYERGIWIVDPQKLQLGNYQVLPEQWYSVENKLPPGTDPRQEVTASWEGGVLMVGCANAWATGNSTVPVFLEFAL